MTMLPTSLVGFRGELEAAIRRELEARRRARRRVAVRIALVAGAAAAVAAGALAALPGDPGRTLVEPASAAQRAAAALTVAPGSIVHADMVIGQRDPDGSHSSWRTESWQQTAPPYDHRQIVTGGNGTRLETATVDGNQQQYDSRRNTVYVSPSDRGTGTVPEGTTPQPASAEPFREQVLDLLRSGRLTQSGRSTVDGRKTVSFTWNDGHALYEYTVEAGTYDPVRWRLSPTESTSGASVTVTFDTYEVLPADAVSLDLTHDHPDATVQHRP